MELFTVIKKDMYLFHGTNQDRRFVIESKPMWFAHNLKTAAIHGKRVIQFRLRKEVKLIDISNQLFHFDFVTKVNNESDLIDEEKFYPLVALGLPDLSRQLSLIGFQSTGIYPNRDNTKTNKDMLKTIDKFVTLFGNKHRLSVDSKDFKSDIVLVNAIKRLYPDVDGYTCNNYWPSYHHGGFLIPETCLFDPTKTILYENDIKSAGKNKKHRAIANTRGGTLQSKPVMPGHRLNPFGGYTFSMDNYCKDTGKSFESMIVSNPIFYAQANSTTS